MSEAINHNAGTSQIDVYQLASGVPASCEVINVQWDDGTILTVEVSENKLSGFYCETGYIEGKLIY